MSGEMVRLSSVFSSISFSTFRPIMSSAISTTLVSRISLRATNSPSLRTVMPSATAITSSRRWVMKIIAIPWEEITRMASRSRSASDSVSTAVGSSNTRIRIPVLSSSLAISINCI